MSGRFQLERLHDDQVEIVRTSPSRPKSPSTGEAEQETVALTDSSTTSPALPGQKDLSVARNNRPNYYISVAQIGRQTASALSYAHARGIIHRDIKPANLLLDSAGTVWVVDFGLAKTGDQGITHTGDLLGTIRYMSPERFRGRCDVRADIYSLGLTLYEMLTLKPAFASSDQLSMIDQVSNTEPLAPRLIDPHIPRDLETIVMKSIDKDPRRRYQSADEMLEDLDRFVQDEPIMARRISLIERFLRWSRHNKELAAALLVLATLMLSVAIASTIAAGHLRQQEVEQRRLALENGRLAEQREVALQLEERGRKESEAQAYHALVGEARALRLARLPGYRAASWTRIESALAIDTPDKSIDRLRQEAAACLGDYMGNEPIIRKGQSRVFSWFPDGERLALATENGVISIRMIETNQEVGRLETGNEVESLRFKELRVSPDGKHVIALAASGAVQVWRNDDSRGWKLLDEHSPPDGRYNPALRHVSDGRRFFTIGHNESTLFMQVRGLADNSQDLPFREIQGPFNSHVWRFHPEISPDGRLMANQVNGTEIGLWSTETGQLEHRIQTPLSGIFTWAFTPDGHSLAVGGDGLVVYEMHDYSQRSQVRLDVIKSLSMSADSRLMAFGTLSRKVWLWNIHAMRGIVAFDAPPDLEFGDPVSISPDGRWLIAASQSESRIWRLKGQPEKLALTGHENFVACTTFSHDGTLLATASKDKTARLWNTKTGELMYTFPLEGFGQTVAFSPDDQLLAVGEFRPTGNLTIWNVRTKQLVGVREKLNPTEPGGVHDLAFVSEGRKLVIAGRSGLEICDMEEIGMAVDGEEIKKLKPLKSLSRPLVRMSVSGDGRSIAYAAGFGIAIWDPWEERHVGRFPDRRLVMQPWHNLSYLPCDQHLLTVAPNGRPQVWDARSGQMAYEIATPRPFLSFHNAVSPNGRWLAADATVEALTIVDLTSRRELFTLGLESAPIKSISWSPDNRHIALGLADGGVAIWDFDSIQTQLADIGLDWQ